MNRCAARSARNPERPSRPRVTGQLKPLAGDHEPPTRTWPAATTSRRSSRRTSGRSTSGEGTSEYRDPVEFFRRTFLTESLGASARRRGATDHRFRRGSGRPAPNELRRREDPLHARPLPPLLGHGPGRASGRRHRPREGRGGRASAREARGARGQQDLAGQSGDQARRHRGPALSGASSPGNSAGKKPSNASVPMTRRPRAPGDGLRALFNDYGPLSGADRRMGGLRAPAP